MKAQMLQRLGALEAAPPRARARRSKRDREEAVSVAVAGGVIPDCGKDADSDRRRAAVAAAMRADL